MKDLLAKVIQKLLFFQPYRKIADLEAQLQKYQVGWPPGHFYSPIPSLEQVKQRDKELFESIPRELPGVDLNETEQIYWFEQLTQYYAEQPFQNQAQPQLRYFFDNPNFCYGEAIILYCLIRHLKPRRIIEVGSGHSSCLILDTNELFLNNAAVCTFIEPYPKLLLSLLKPGDADRIQIVTEKLQEIDVKVFTTLEAGDILFIDSTHISKIDSDVNHLFFRILPHLKPGVYVHLHDIYYPFEYPRSWIYQGRAWNEAYLLRAFLQYNSAFKIIFFNSFWGYFYQDKLLKDMPLLAKHTGSSIWLQKL